MNAVKSIFAAAAALASLISVGTVHAGADAIGGRQATAGATAAQAAPQQPASGVAIKHVTLAEAIRSAEQRTNGRARAIEMERDNGLDVYEVKTVSKDGKAKVFVDLATGKVSRVVSRRPKGRTGNAYDAEEKREEEARFNALQSSHVSLLGAIDAAEKNTGGRAIKAKMKDRHGNAIYEVDVMVDGSKQEVEVDAATAKVVAESSTRMFRRHHDDEDNDRENDRDHRRDHDDDKD